MSLYKELAPYFDYMHSIRKLEDYVSFDFKFPTNWSFPKSITEGMDIVAFEVKETNKKGISFVTKIDDENFKLVLSKISKIIKLNKEKEMKEELFKEMIQKLKSTFETNNLEKLQKLHFEFENEQKKLNDYEYDILGQERENVELVGE